MLYPYLSRKTSDLNRSLAYDIMSSAYEEVPIEENGDFFLRSEILALRLNILAIRRRARSTKNLKKREQRFIAAEVLERMVYQN